MFLNLILSIYFILKQKKTDKGAYCIRKKIKINSEREIIILTAVDWDLENRRK